MGCDGSGGMSRHWCEMNRINGQQKSFDGWTEQSTPVVGAAIGRCRSPIIIRTNHLFFFSFSLFLASSQMKVAFSSLKNTVFLTIPLYIIVFVVWNECSLIRFCNWRCGSIDNNNENVIPHNWIDCESKMRSWWLEPAPCCCSMNNIEWSIVWPGQWRGMSVATK